MLTVRTEKFCGVSRSPEHLDDFARGEIGFTPPDRPFPNFHHCPFLGLIDSGKRVGCLLHPLGEGNNGVDWRGLSYYGGFACRTYFCPTMTRMPDRHKTIVINAFDGWYDFGLVLTERRLLASYFREIEIRIGRSVGPSDFPKGSSPALLFSKLCRLKMNWTYRRRHAPGPANFFFENGEYERGAVIYPGSHSTPSRFDSIFRELETGFETIREQEQAETVLSSHLRELISALTKRRHHDTRTV